VTWRPLVADTRDSIASWASVSWSRLIYESAALLAPGSRLARAVQISLDELVPTLQRRSFPATLRSRRARGRRSVFRCACVLATAAWVAEVWLCHGGKLPEEGIAPLRRGSEEWKRIFPRCLEASRASFWGGFAHDKRGRLENLAQMLLDSEKVDNAALGRALSSASVFGYSGDRRGPPQGAPAAHVALPKVAAVVPLDKHCPSDLCDRFHDPPLVSRDEPRPVGYMGFTMAQWYGLARRMLRSGLGVLLPSDAARPEETAGAFPVIKGKVVEPTGERLEYRLVGDRRPRNHGEGQLGKARLPYAPRLQRGLLRAGHVWRVHGRNLSNCYFAFAVRAERWQIQTIGPRVPRAWFDRLSEEALDDLPPPCAWVWEDLCRGSPLVLPPAVESKPDHAWMAMTGVMMGDGNAVLVIQETHKNMLTKAGVLDPAWSLCPDQPFPQGDLIADVLINDLGVVFQVPADLAAARSGPDFSLTAAADALYEQEGLPQSIKKAITGVTEGADMWGAWIVGTTGVMGVHLDKRITLAPSHSWLSTAGSFKTLL